MEAVAGVKPKKKRSLWWTVHHWAGLKVSLFLTFILATGTLATLSHEIDWLIHPEMRAAAPNGEPATWGMMLDSAQKAVDATSPGARVERISAPYDLFFAAEAIAVDGNGERFRIHLNPATGEAQGITGWFNAQRLFRELHRHLMLPAKVGIPIVSILSLPLLASLITAFVVYKRWWRGFFRLPKLRQPGKGKRAGDGRRFTGDLHRFAGLWSLWFIAVIGISGLWYLIEWGGGNAPAAMRPKMALPVASLQGQALDTAVQAAKAAYPELQVTSIYMPNNKRGGIVVMGQAEAVLMRERGNAVLVNPETGQAMQVQKGMDLSLHQRIAEGADPLHFGSFANHMPKVGFAVRLLWFVVGVILTGLAVTGIMIFAMRLKPADRPAGVTNPSMLGDMWRGMGYFALPAAIATSIGLVLAIGAIFGG